MANKRIIKLTDKDKMYIESLKYNIKRSIEYIKKPI